MRRLWRRVLRAIGFRPKSDPFDDSVEYLAKTLALLRRVDRAEGDRLAYQVQGILAISPDYSDPYARPRALLEACMAAIERSGARLDAEAQR